MRVARFFKRVEKTPLTLFLSNFCYSESFITVFIRRNEYPESPQLHIELQLMFQNLQLSCNIISKPFVIFLLVLLV